LVTIRNFHQDDITAYIQLANYIDKVDRLSKATSLEEFKHRIEQPGYHFEEDLFVAEVDGLLVGYAAIERELEIGRTILDIAVHPTHRGRGMGSSLLETAANHSHNLGSEVLQIPIAQGLHTSERWVRARGFRAVRCHWHMSLAEYREMTLTIPSGFELTHFLPGEEESLCTLQNMSFTDSWGFRPNTVEEICYLLDASWCRPDGILYINNSQTKVGYCWTMEHPNDRDKGYIRMMGINPQYRGRGLGKTILIAGIEYLLQNGIKEIELSVDGRNHIAKHLYQSVGFRRKGVTLWHQRNLGSC
jgi:mycothiol synthase